jgi:hypothetical protein
MDVRLVGCPLVSSKLEPAVRNGLRLGNPRSLPYGGSGNTKSRRAETRKQSGTRRKRIRIRMRLRWLQGNPERLT